ncbi:ABC transporter substrate-binding protein [Corynebacterium mendelii]|uniref:ABC transporter substrate-binding protein n=1 Tax=Corynebacterium mendelii TaxID=2765362 RepID=A0A939E3M1_9CORY|nr:ABC transporter substrate-binding protein [Corynebacterium mendelii]MBN9644982.1 ABC transporter substrate-binding protein [Corynebacterium mendelii]
MTRLTRSTVVLLTAGLIAAGCTSTADDSTTGSTTASPADHATSATAADSDGAAVTVTNCGIPVEFDSHGKLFVNEGNILATVLSAGGADSIAAVSSVQRDIPVLQAKYGAATIDRMPQVSPGHPSLDQIVAQQPDIFVGGWNYGLSKANKITPKTLDDRGIATYILTETCRLDPSSPQGIIDPFVSVKQDLVNWGSILGDSTQAEDTIADIDERLAALDRAPKPDTPPVVFVIDSVSETVFTTGNYGAPNAIIDRAGADNATGEIEDSWVAVGWEKIAETRPDAFIFVDYPGQSLDEKIAQLESNPLTRDLPAVQHHRFINVPYAMMTTGPLAVDGAEYVRHALQQLDLVPDSSVTPQLSLPESVAGREYLTGVSR